MIPGKLNFTCPQGSTFARTLTYKIDDEPVNLNGYNARIQIRDFSYSKFPILSYDSSESSEYIYTGGSAGTINIYINPEITESLDPGTYVYDLEIYTSSNVYRLVEGQFKVSAEVTR